ncbi:MAG: hypothetical protein QME60_05440, partial [Verrucomicrobiota bacterium]|nr:hypothetical protein [Verrucomicrobiota bacterium]
MAVTGAERRQFLSVKNKSSLSHIIPDSFKSRFQKGNRSVTRWQGRQGAPRAFAQLRKRAHQELSNAKSKRY